MMCSYSTRGGEFGGYGCWLEFVEGCWLCLSRLGVGEGGVRVVVVLVLGFNKFHECGVEGGVGGVVWGWVVGGSNVASLSRRVNGCD